MEIQKLINEQLIQLISEEFPGQMVKHVKIEDISVDADTKVSQEPSKCRRFFRTVCSNNHTIHRRPNACLMTALRIN